MTGTGLTRALTRAPLWLGLLAALAWAGCSSEGGAASAQELADRQIRVVATTNWHTDLAEQIGGERVQVEGLMGPGVDPHLYAATAGDVQTLQDADIAIWNGLALEGKMEEVFAEVGERRPVVAVGEAVPVQERIPVTNAPGKEFDPHVWFDTGAWEHAGRAVADAFAKLDPEHAAGYQKRLRAFTAELERTDEAIREQVERIPQKSRVLVTSHDAFSYFARAYGFEVAAIQGKSTAGEATTADIRRVAAEVADADLKMIFPESSVPQQTIEAVLGAARQLGQQAAASEEDLFGDALGAPGSPEGTYAGALRHNARLIVEGLAP